MRQRLFITAGILLLLVAIGTATSDDFFAHYGLVVRQEQAAEVGGVMSPLDIKQVSPEYFSLIVEPDDGIAPVLNRIQHAQKSIDLVMYTLADTQVEQALGQAAARGVAVRVLLNGGYYSKKEGSNDAPYAALQTLNVPVKWTPTTFALTHQKTLIIDGNDALIMTFNLQSKYYATGRDFAVDDTDPNDVAAIEKTFDADWKGSSITAPQGDDLVWSPGSEEELLYLINSAMSSLKIYNEELEDDDIVSALVAAAKRGVVVQLDMTYATNWKPMFTELSQAGVQVRTYASTSKVRYIHAKMILADNARVFLGSENFSNNSMNKNRELGLVLTSPAIIEGLDKIFASDWAAARPFVVVK
jgi:cardiolipin synthase